MYRYINKIFFYSLVSILPFSLITNSNSDELKEILEIIQKDLRTLERAVYSESFSGTSQNSSQENSLKQTIKSIISESEECNQSKPVDNALNIIKCNSVQVAENIQSQLNLANTEDVFGSKSAIVRICGASNQLGQQSRGKNYNSILSNSTGKMSPNLGKSRYVSKQEARNKLTDICIAFTKLGITMPPISIRQIGVNSFAVFRGQ